MSPLKVQKVTGLKKKETSVLLSFTPSIDEVQKIDFTKIVGWTFKYSKETKHTIVMLSYSRQRGDNY